MVKWVFFVVAVQPALGQLGLRMNQVGFLPADVKTAVVLCKDEIADVSFTVSSGDSENVVLRGKLRPMHMGYGQFPHVYSADFTSVQAEGEYFLRVNESTSRAFRIGKDLYRRYLEYPMQYILQQRCGYNPVFDTVCHRSDGIAVDGPDDGKKVDVSGGYHDASDYLRFLLTTSCVVGSLLVTYEEYPDLWSDLVDANGRTGKNGIPDLLDEARWGIDWLLKLAPGGGRLYHQVADDRDHSFWDLPFRDDTDYGWGKGKERPVYFATGSPQGLFQHKNASTGVSNVAGRTAAVFAIASKLWKQKLGQADVARVLLSRSEELYALGVASSGVSESVPCRAPYRYHEKTFYDDLEWGAIELFRATGKRSYLEAAVQYAVLAADTSWMDKDSARHYEYFPYVNLGHYRLYGVADVSTKEKLRRYYRAGLDAARRRGAKNAFGYGVPFIWVSNNLATSLATQALLYKKMSGSDEFDDVLFATRDWLFGRNPWGQSFVIGVPNGGSFPEDPHSVVGKELGLRLTGALVDGPVFASIFNSLMGLRLVGRDEFAEYQSTEVVYHDDIGDYSTNEPTLDGTASLLFLLAYFSAES